MSNKGHHGVIAIFDVSSSSVAGAHVLMQSRTCPATTILTSVRSDTLIRDDIDVERFVTDTNALLGTIATTVRTQDLHHPTMVQIILASPWYTAQTRSVVYRKDTPFTCTKKLIDSLIEAEIKHVLAKEEGPFGAFGNESVIVEQQLSGIKLNGYHTHVPYGKKVTSLEFSLIVTIAPKRILDMFSETLKRAYGLRTIRYTTNTFSTFVVMRDRVRLDDACVVIDVGEEITDIAFVKNGIVLQQHSFPLGTFGLYRAIGKHDVDVLHESHALLEAYRLGKLTAPERRKVEKALTSFSDKWQEGFRQVIEEGHYGFCLPHRLLVTVEAQFELLFARMIEEDPFIKYKCAADAIILTYINEALLAHDVSTQDHSAIDSPLAVGALFAERVQS